MKDIKAFEGLYAITENGRVWSYPRQWISGRGVVRKHRGLFLRNGIDEDGYEQVGISKLGKSYCRKIHRLVAETYIPNPNAYTQINHINGNKRDNSITNLEWCTPLHNTREAIRLGLKGVQGSRNPNAKLTDNDVRRIRRMVLEKSQTEIAREYHVTGAVISDIVNRNLWTHI